MLMRSPLCMIEFESSMGALVALLHNGIEVLLGCSSSLSAPRTSIHSALRKDPPLACRTQTATSHEDQEADSHHM